MKVTMKCARRADGHQLNCDKGIVTVELCEKSGTETCVPEALALVAKCWLARVTRDVLCHRFEHVDMLP